jgi:hypothetical protein
LNKRINTKQCYKQSSLKEKKKKRITYRTLFGGSALVQTNPELQVLLTVIKNNVISCFPNDRGGCADDFPFRWLKFSKGNHKPHMHKALNID